MLTSADTAWSYSRKLRGPTDQLRSSLRSFLAAGGGLAGHSMSASRHPLHPAGRPLVPDPCFAWPFRHVHLPGLAGLVVLAAPPARRIRNPRRGHRPRPAGPEHDHERAGPRRGHPYPAGPPAGRGRPGGRVVPGAAAAKSQGHTGVPAQEGAISRVVRFDTYDVRFPTSVRAGGSDAMNPEPGLLRRLRRHPDRRAGPGTAAGEPLAGHSYVFTIGQGQRGPDRRDPRARAAGGRATRRRDARRPGRPSPDAGSATARCAGWDRRRASCTWPSARWSTPCWDLAPGGPGKPLWRCWPT